KSIDLSNLTYACVHIWATTIKSLETNSGLGKRCSIGASAMSSVASFSFLPRRLIEASIAAIALVAAAAGAARPEDIVVPIDMAAPVRLSAPAEGVAIGNPAIAGVSVQSDRLLFVTGRAYGTTNLVIVGPGGRTLFNGRVTVMPDESGQVTVTRGTDTMRL